MAIARVQTVGTFDGVSSGGADTVVFPVTQTHVAGNDLLFSIGINFDATVAITDSKGNTYTVDAQTTFASTTGLIVARTHLTTQLVNTDTITFDFSTGTGVGLVGTEFSGLTNAPADRSAQQSDGPSTSHTSGSTATTTQADELLFGAHCAVDGSGTWTSTGGFTEESDLDYAIINRNLVAQYQIVSAAAAYASTGTSSASVVAHNAITTYKGIYPAPVAWLKA